MGAMAIADSLYILLMGFPLRLRVWTAGMSRTEAISLKLEKLLFSIYTSEIVRGRLCSVFKTDSWFVDAVMLIRDGNEAATVVI